MKLLSLTCNHCGAPIDVPRKTKFVTCSFCDARLQVVHSGSGYYTEVMEVVEDLRAELQELRRDAAIERLDREWERRQAELSIRDDHGRLHRPGVGTALIGFLGLSAMGVFTLATGLAAQIGYVPLLLFPAAVAYGVWALQRAARYDQAYQEYRRKRRELMRRES